MSVSADGQKHCPDCGETKPVTAFSRNASRPDGLQFYCKSCFSARAALTYRKKRARLGKTVRERVEVPDGYKRCPGCERILPAERWHRTRRTRDGLASECKDCRSVRQRRDHLKRTFGLTLDGLEALVTSQGGVCAICRDGKPEHIDHDHDNGKVRGALCGPCNMGLGLFKDDPARLEAAIGYLVRARLAATATVVEQPSCVIELAGARLHAA
jgi:hypothetical protein